MADSNDNRTDGACLTPELIRKTIANWKISMGRLEYPNGCTILSEKTIANWKIEMGLEEYPNGCTILSEGPQKDDL
jgi:hypothetical protein